MTDKTIQERINETESLPKEKVKEAIEIFNEKMEQVTEEFKKQQAEGDILSQNIILDKET